MRHCLPNGIETKKCQKKISPNLGHSWGGGRDGKCLHFPPFFLKLYRLYLKIFVSISETRFLCHGRFDLKLQIKDNSLSSPNYLEKPKLCPGVINGFRNMIYATSEKILSTSNLFHFNHFNFNFNYRGVSLI